MNENQDKVFNKNGDLLIYENDNDIKVEVILQNENVWMTQEQISKLYDKSKSTINEHIKNIYEENELLEVNTMRKFGNSEFSTKPTNFYNLELIITEATELEWRHTKINADELEVGDNISIIFTGSIQETEPAEINDVIKIQLLDDEK